MCKWGTEKTIYVIRRNNVFIPDGWHEMSVDSCLADFVQRLNHQGIITIGCCCGHGKSEPSVLVSIESELLLQEAGIRYHIYRSGETLELEAEEIPR